MSTHSACPNQHFQPWFLGALLTAASAVTAARDAPPTYHLLKEIPIAGDTGWDYLSIDSQARRRIWTRTPWSAISPTPRGCTDSP
jgi:hypothetical protein